MHPSCTERRSWVRPGPSRRRAGAGGGEARPLPYAHPEGGCPVPPYAWSHSSRAGICKVSVHCAFLCAAGGSRHWSRWRYTYHSGKLLPASIWTVWTGTLQWGQPALLWKQIEYKDGNFYWWKADGLSWKYKEKFPHPLLELLKAAGLWTAHRPPPTHPPPTRVNSPLGHVGVSKANSSAYLIPRMTYK